MSETGLDRELVVLTADIVAAFVANNMVKPTQIADLIAATHSSLATAAAGAKPEPEAERVEPAVSVRKSLASKDFILSLIDGKPYRLLKRHLAKHGLTPAQYRTRYNLPDSYPMAAPAFREARREAALRRGLGRKPGGTGKNSAGSMRSPRGRTSTGG